MELLYHFSNTQKTQNTNERISPELAAAEKKLVSSKGLHQAPVGQSYALELFIENVNKDVNSKLNNTHHVGDNLTQGERKALKDIRSWITTEIRPFDKGKGFVIDTKENYFNRMMKDLNDTSVYEILYGTPEEEVTKINATIKDWTIICLESQCITPKLATWIINKYALPGNIYQNYKAHKPEKGYPGRTIASVCGAPIENISKWLEHYIGPIAKTLEYRVDDSNEVLCKVHHLNNSTHVTSNLDNIILVSWDITAMFPNIDNTSGMNAVRNKLEQRTENSPTTSNIMEALEITLNNNISKFEGRVFRQTNGTAMGPSHSCSYADIAVDILIDQIVMDPNQNPIFHANIRIWMRFRDDIFSMWEGEVEKLIEFDKWLNNIDEKLKFVMQYSNVGIEFLDLYIHKSNGQLKTDIYSKKCDPHAYLLPTSCHPIHTCKNIPFSVVSRVKRCCSDNELYKIGVEKYSNHLRNREYSDEIIEEAIHKVNALDRESLIGLTSTPREADNPKSQVYPFVMKYNSQLPNMNDILNKHKHILTTTENTASLFKPESIFVSHKVEHNIQKLITKSRFSKSKQYLPNEDQNVDTHKTGPTLEIQSPSVVIRETGKEESGCHKCESKTSCKTCKLFILQSKHAWSYHTDEKFEIKNKLTCTSNNVIYIIQDQVCCKSYIGSTGDKFKDRWANHKSHIKQNRPTCEIVSHVIEHCNDVHTLDRSNVNSFDAGLKHQLKIMIIEQVDIPHSVTKTQKKQILEAREAIWQLNLKTGLGNGGLNKRS